MESGMALRREGPLRLHMRPLAELLRLPESEWLDFKREFHTNTCEFVHDLLCLANSRANSDRYLVFGIEDKSRNVFGVESDPARRNNQQVQDILWGSSFNRLPTVRLDDLNHDSHIISVLTIENRQDKPFFLTKDKVEGKLRLRNGVVYTRIGENNVPMSEAAPEAMVEEMWRERFGIDLVPLERMRRLLDDQTRWVEAGGEPKTVHHLDFPDFTIVDGEELCDDFKEDWATSFPDERAWSYYVELRCRTTVLEKLLFVTCDGGRYRLPAPDHVKSGEWRLSRSSLSYKVARLYHQYGPLDDALHDAGIELIE